MSADHTFTLASVNCKNWTFTSIKTVFLFQRTHRIPSPSQQNHEITREVNVILKMKEPTSIEEINRFLGMVTYYSRFISNLSTLTAPLRQPLAKNAKFYWNRKCSEAYDQLKQETASERVLTPFDPALPSSTSRRCQPSRSCGDTFSHHQWTRASDCICFEVTLEDRKALAIIFSVGHIHQYLFARPFKLITDNQPLVRIFHQNAEIPQMTSARLQRYAAFLSGFNYEVIYKKGTENSNIDCLARAPIELTPNAENPINTEVNQICESLMEIISTL